MLTRWTRSFGCHPRADRGNAEGCRPTYFRGQNGQIARQAAGRCYAYICGLEKRMNAGSAICAGTRAFSVAAMGSTVPIAAGKRHGRRADFSDAWGHHVERREWGRWRTGGLRISPDGSGFGQSIKPVAVPPAKPVSSAGSHGSPSRCLTDAAARIRKCLSRKATAYLDPPMA